MFKKVPAAYVPPLLGLSYHFPYNCSNGSEVYQLWSLHIVDLKPYKTNKFNTFHYNFNGDLSCIFVWFGKTQGCQFR